tara:strand:+ start:1227 stop:2972 length:1746 start_codon:yes stop_codon:yes gene_type:complete
MTFKEHVEENFAKLEAVKQANTPDLMNGGAIRFGELSELYTNQDAPVSSKEQIKNSYSNRPVMLSEAKPKKEKLDRKLVYAIQFYSGVSSMNWLPMGILPDTNCIQLEDRGHFTGLLIERVNHEWKVATWKRVLKRLEALDYNPMINEYIERIQHRIDYRSKKFSLDSLNTPEDKKRINDYMIPYELKVYPNRDMHDNEITGINSLDDKWTTHQLAMKAVEKNTRTIHGVDNTIIKDRYELVRDNDLFLGNNKFSMTGNAKQASKMENHEEEPMMIFAGALATSKTMHEMYNALGTSSEDKRTTMYEKAIEQFQTLEDWKGLVKDIKVVLINDVYMSMLQKTIDKTFDTIEKQNMTGTNVKDLTPRKVDASLMIVYTALKLSEARKLRPTEKNLRRCAEDVIKTMESMIKDTEKMKELCMMSSTAKTRALNFFQPLLETCIQNSDENQDDSKDLLIRTSLEIVEQDEIQIVTDRPITILDREENDRDGFKFVEVVIDEGKGLHLGHCKSGDDSGGFFLQPAGDNIFWDNKRDFVPSEYADEYMSEVATYLAGVSSTWFSDAKMMQAYTNTQNLANIWKHGG